MPVLEPGHLRTPVHPELLIEPPGDPRVDRGRFMGGRHFFRRPCSAGRAESVF